MIAVLSGDYLESVYGSAEWQAMWASDPDGTGRKLLPLRVADCDMAGAAGGGGRGGGPVRAERGHCTDPAADRDRSGARRTGQACCCAGVSRRGPGDASRATISRGPPACMEGPGAQPQLHRTRHRTRRPGPGPDGRVHSHGAVGTRDGRGRQDPACHRIRPRACRRL